MNANTGSDDRSVRSEDENRWGKHTLGVEGTVSGARRRVRGAVRLVPRRGDQRSVIGRDRHLGDDAIEVISPLSAIEGKQRRQSVLDGRIEERGIHRAGATQHRDHRVVCDRPPITHQAARVAHVVARGMSLHQTADVRNL